MRPRAYDAPRVGTADDDDAPRVDAAPADEKESESQATRPFASGA